MEMKNIDENLVLIVDKSKILKRTPKLDKDLEKLKKNKFNSGIGRIIKKFDNGNLLLINDDKLCCIKQSGIEPIVVPYDFGFEVPKNLIQIMSPNTGTIYTILTINNRGVSLFNGCYQVYTISFDNLLNNYVTLDGELLGKFNPKLSNIDKIEIRRFIYE